MKPAGWIISFCIAAIGLPLVTIAQEPVRRCATVYYDSLLKAQNPAYRKSRETLEQLIQQQKHAAHTQGSARTQADLLVIPIVVHVVHTNANGTIGGSTNSNISDEQINAQITILNQDFRRKEGTPGFNDNPVGADVGIEFKLAGITRHYSTKASYSPEERALLSTIISWPTDCYLNVWVTTMSDSFLGYTQFPDATGLPGLDPVNGLEASDGVMIDYRYFGTGGTVTSRLYNGGRTATHEIGHWLGLLHTWGNHNNNTCYCGDSDYVDDTPEARCANENSCTPVSNDCSGQTQQVMIENYLDYSPDRCMNIFTQGQKERIWQTLSLSPRRKRLVECSSVPLPASETLTITLSPNPFAGTSTDELKVEVLLKGVQDVSIDIINYLGSQIYSKSFSQIPSKKISITPGNLVRGVYLVRVRTANETQIKRLVVD